MRGELDIAYPMFILEFNAFYYGGEHFILHPNVPDLQLILQARRNENVSAMRRPLHLGYIRLMLLLHAN